MGLAPTCYCEHRVTSWKELVDLVTSDRYKRWAFRGQAKTGWDLWSALSRHLHDHKVHPDHWQAQEERVLRIFKRKAHLYLQHIPDEDDDFEWMALMQHHGAPTRLIDFTWSPYVAAFFALERSKEDAAVWGVNPVTIKDDAPELTLEDGTVVHPRDCDPRAPGNMRRYFVRSHLPFIWLGEPYVMNQRLIAQSGTFVVQSLLGEPVESVLSRYPDPDRTVVKIELVGEALRTEALEELYRMNITHATLFPGLDGLARSLAYELEFHWAHDVRAPRGRPTRP